MLCSDWTENIKNRIKYMYVIQHEVELAQRLTSKPLPCTSCNIVNQKTPKMSKYLIIYMV